MDNCAFNRPFDDQNQIRIKIETEAKLYIQQEIDLGRIELVWSYINESENLQNPYPENRSYIFLWKKIAAVKIYETKNILTNADNLVKLGLKAGDALHLASAIEGNADYFVTTDDGILRKIKNYLAVEIVNPTELISKIT